MKFFARYAFPAAVVASTALLGCHHDSSTTDAGSAVATPVASSSGNPGGVDMTSAPTDGPVIAAKGRYVMIRDRPDKKKAKKFGYIRLGGIVAREEKLVSRHGCKGGWYRVKPRGFACMDEDSTLDRNDPVVRAASRRPDLRKPMPYAYGFVRSVLPLYLHIPSRKEQFKAEFKLKDHLEWWGKEGQRLNTEIPLGANDVFVDGMGVPHDDLAVAKKTTSMTEGELFGGKTDHDPPPWWLKGGRKIPNVSAFKVPKTAIFADRARRHAGLAFVGSFSTGPESLNRRFAITEDLRLAPTSKVKPDLGPTFHGVVIGGDLELPFAWIKRRNAKRYKLTDDSVRAYKKRAKYRQVVGLTRKKRFVKKKLYYEMTDGKWVRARDIAIATAPSKMPGAAKSGEKWIDISIRQQVLVLWEGKKPVYGTLVSTGQDLMGDPKTTKSTVRGTFRIYAKHITTKMDSNVGLTRNSNDPEYGKTKRRGQGTFLLQHIPWVQYFHGSYALHATYWHDVFGTARSHGCVNLSPIDAHRIFFWTEPKVPRGWHAVYSGEKFQGTVVYSHE